MITRYRVPLLLSSVLLLLAILFSLFTEPTGSQTKVRANQLALGDVFAFTGANTHSGLETFTGNTVFSGGSPWFDVTAPAYGAKCDGSTDDTTAINAALTAAQAAGGGTVFLPPGKTCAAVGPITLDLMNGVTLTGANFLVGWQNGAIQGKPLLKISGTTSPLVSARSSVSVRIIGVNITYTSASFSGEVVGTEHTGVGCGGGGCDTNQFVIQDSSISGVAGTAVSAICGVCLDKTIDSWVIRTTFENMVNGIRGQSALATYSINNRIEGNQLSVNSAGVGSISGTLILNPGAGWKIANNDFEFGLAPAQAASTPTGIDFSNGNCLGCTVDTNFFGDMPAGWTGTVLKNIGVASGSVLVIGNNAQSGSSALGTFMSFANGATGISVKNNTLSNYANVFSFPSVAMHQIEIGPNTYSGTITAWSNNSGTSTPNGGVFFDNGDTYTFNGIEGTPAVFAPGGSTSTCGMSSAVQGFACAYHGSSTFSKVPLVGITNTWTAAQTLGAGGSLNVAALLISQTAPTISTHFNTSGDSIVTNGTASFTITVGTGTGTSTGALALPTATTGWTCWLTNTNRADLIQQTGSTTASATFTNFGTTFAATNWTNSDVLRGGCTAN